MNFIRFISLTTILVFYLLIPLESIHSVSFTKYEFNPILIKTENSWDSDRVWQPSVLVENNGYKMLYSGFNGSRFQIGLALSNDGITWSKFSNNPILSRLSVDNKDAHDPIIIKVGNSYEAWYVSSDGGGGSNFKINRAESEDSISWTTNPLTAVLYPTGLWDQNGVSSPFILKIGTEYKMWFSGFSQGWWRIGYASSPDGINWTPYSGNPIIDLSSQNQHADGASVIYNGSSYDLYFHGINGVVSKTTSADGITNWSTPTTVLNRGAPYDNDYMAGPSALKLPHGTTLLYYGGLSSGTWKINLAMDGPIAPPSPTPTPIPTPTPTPSQKKKVIVLHGAGGSWNRDALLNCKPNNYSGSWGPWPTSAGNVYQSLVDHLKNEGFEPTLYYYDWRKQTTTTAPLLSDFITSHSEQSEKINLVGHSLGGLIARAYLELSQSNTKIDKLLTIGSPHQGAALAYPAWSGGEIWMDDITMRLGLAAIQVGCKLKKGWSARETIQNLFPSTQNILPTVDYLFDKKSGEYKLASTMHAKNNWLPGSFTAPFFGVTVGTMGGTGMETLTDIEVTKPSIQDVRADNWKDGKPTGVKLYEDGDGTVLLNSSLLLDADNIVLPLDHGALVHDDSAKGAITNFLGGNATVETLHQQSQNIKPKKQVSALLIILEGAQGTLTDSLGNETADTDGQITVLDPSAESYTLSARPLSIRYKIVVVQLYEDGTMKWKEYRKLRIQHKKFSLRFDRLHKKEDILQDD